MKGLFGYEISEEAKPIGKRLSTAIRPNPMIAAYGPCKIDGQRCKDCKHLYYRQFARKYFKCDLRGDTRGPGTDHRKHWLACAKFERDE